MEKNESNKSKIKPSIEHSSKSIKHTTKKSNPWLQSAGDIDEKLRKEFRRRIPKIEDEIKKEINEMKDDNLTLFGNKPNTKKNKRWK